MVVITSTNEQENNANKDIDQDVTYTIIKQLEVGTIPWLGSAIHDSYVPMQQQKNPISGNTYRGINTLLLWGASINKRFPCNEWASFKQWKANNETIRKDEKGTMIVYQGSLEKPSDSEIGKPKALKHSFVFNRSQLASYIPNSEEVIESMQPYNENFPVADEFIANTLADIEHFERECFYDASNDRIVLPERRTILDTKQGTAPEKYYSALMREMIRWTGAPKRLNQKINNKLGTKEHVEEELTCEIGAAFLLAEFGITNPMKVDYVDYIKLCLDVLKDNKEFIISAANAANKAVGYLKGLQPLKLTT